MQLLIVNQIAIIELFAILFKMKELHNIGL